MGIDCLIMNQIPLPVETNNLTPGSEAGVNGLKTGDRQGDGGDQDSDPGIDK